MFNWQTACKRKIQQWRSYCTTEKRKRLLPSALAVCHLWCPLQSCTTHLDDRNISPGDCRSAHLTQWQRYRYDSPSPPLEMPTAELYNSPGDRNISPGDCRSAHLTQWQRYRYDSPSPPLEMPTAELHNSPGDCWAAHLTWWQEHLTRWLQSCTPHLVTGTPHQWLLSCTPHLVTGTPHRVTAELNTSPGDGNTSPVTAELHTSPGDRNTSPGDCRAAHLTWWQEHLTSDCWAAHLTWWWEHLTALQVWLTQSTLGTVCPLKPHGWGGLSGMRPVWTWPNSLCISIAILAEMTQSVSFSLCSKYSYTFQMDCVSKTWNQNDC